MTSATLLAKQGLLHKINLALTALQLNVTSENAGRLFDINTVVEDFLASFLGKLYDLSLENLNYPTHYPAVDLGDKNKKHAIQVTATGSKQKVKDTLETFVKHVPAGEFNRVQVVIIGKRRGKYAGLQRASQPAFNPDKDVIGIPQLAKHISNSDTLKLQQLCDIIDQEMPIMKAFAGLRKPSDIDTIHEYRTSFDRPALQDSWRGERQVVGFAQALDDLISLLNTGVVKGAPVTKRRVDIDNEHWRNAVEILYQKVRSLRELYTIHVNSGEIDESTNCCRFHDNRMFDVFDEYKQAVVSELNRLLEQAGLPPIHGVGGMSFR